MKSYIQKEFHKLIKYLFAFIAIYLIGIGVGIFSFSFAQIRSQNQQLINEIRNFLGVYNYHQSSIAGYSLHYEETTLLTYDAEGTCNGYIISLMNSDSEFDFRTVLDAHALDNQTAAYQGHLYIRDWNSIYWIVSRGLFADGQYKGCVFLVLRLRSLPLIITCFLIVYTVILIALGSVLFLFHYQETKNEQLRQNYIGNISHDLKNPIATIKAVTEMLSEDLIDSPVTRSMYYGTIIREANQMERVVGEMLELSRIQSAKTSYKKESITPMDLFGNLFQDFEVLCEDLSIHFEVDPLIRESTFTLYTHPVSCRRILDILLSNAVKFVDIGGHIRIQCTERKHDVVFSVKDDGIGISKEDQKRIFEQFYTNKTHNPNGTGLGLSIARGLCSSLHEEIWVESAPGEGSTFFFTVIKDKQRLCWRPGCKRRRRKSA